MYAIIYQIGDEIGIVEKEDRNGNVMTFKTIQEAKKFMSNLTGNVDIISLEPIK